MGLVRFDRGGITGSIPRLARSARILALIPLVAKKLGGARIVKLHQRVEALRLMGLAPGAIEGQRISSGMGAEMDFGREAAARAAERFLILIPPYGWPASPARSCKI